MSAPYQSFSPGKLTKYIITLRTGGTVTVRASSMHTDVANSNDMVFSIQDYVVADLPKDAVTMVEATERVYP